MLTAPQNLPLRLNEIHRRIAAAAAAAGRDPLRITLIAVSKTHPAEAIRAAAAAGARDFGENYVQEAADKVDALRDLGATWHFIGALQSNKTRPVAERFDWVHTVDRLKIAERLSAQRPRFATALNLCLQVHLGDEPSKAGATPDELPALAAAVEALPRVRLRGLMCIPPEETDPDRQRHWFRQLRDLRDQLVARGHELDTLSMGMSGDFEAAIAEGATHVRIGTAIFGPRE
ncbi:MAG: YggS family pyridoxal phosphate-dependent enzyme [Gammaproteobacteria bacterium]|nr:YggS family pyridoxal phosphate-dependent enzyme [Gammaproteobacteria bacterium]